MDFLQIAKYFKKKIKIFLYTIQKETLESLVNLDKSRASSFVEEWARSGKPQNPNPCNYFTMNFLPFWM